MLHTSLNAATQLTAVSNIKKDYKDQLRGVLVIDICECSLCSLFPQWQLFLSARMSGYQMLLPAAHLLGICRVSKLS